jgi:hypothetical protein
VRPPSAISVNPLVGLSDAVFHVASAFKKGRKSLSVLRQYSILDFHPENVLKVSSSVRAQGLRVFDILISYMAIVIVKL